MHPHVLLLTTASASSPCLHAPCWLQLPVIMLAARHNEQAVVACLEGGASDYVVKPFRRSELMARIRMHLREAKG
jgi:DNA-binding response OmpR family regulator